MRVQHTDGENVFIEFCDGFELSMSRDNANKLRAELSWVLDAINPDPAPQTSDAVDLGASANIAQQLKLKIAAYRSELNHLTDTDDILITDVLDKLRQLLSD